jgi:hypothetical protein
MDARCEQFSISISQQMLPAYVGVVSLSSGHSAWLTPWVREVKMPLWGCYDPLKMDSPSTTIRNTPNEIPVLWATVASSSTYTAASMHEPSKGFPA